MAEKRAVVFVIDDDPSMRGALDNLIGSVGLDVRLFASPHEFLACERPDAPGCLVLDVRLQGMTGLAFHEELVKQGVALPVIFITGHADVPMTVRAMKAGAVEFLTKPFRDVELLDAIHAAIERDRGRREEAASLDMLRLRYGQLTARTRGHGAGGRRLANKQVATASASASHGKVHRGQVMRKMRARSLPDLVRMADRLGLAIEAVTGSIPKS
jgi:FixJ family two-component response regulator